MKIFYYVYFLFYGVRLIKHQVPSLSTNAQNIQKKLFIYYIILILIIILIFEKINHIIKNNYYIRINKNKK